MSAAVPRPTEPVLPRPGEAAVARETGRILAAHVMPDGDLKIRIIEDGREAETVALPRSAVRLLLATLGQIADGNAVAVIPVHAELSTQEAADLLVVSRPFLIGLLEDGKIPYRRVGTHRRILLRDLLAFKRGDDAARDQAYREMVAANQAMGFYDE